MLCYGDSNTYGYFPNGMYGDRYTEDVRWTGLIEKEGFTVINEGLCGRRIPASPHRIDAFVERMNAGTAPDVLMIMLGGNDLIQDDDAAPETVAARMDHFLAELKRIRWFDPSHTLLCAPALLKPGSWVSGPEMLEKSGRLGSLYAEAARKHGIVFADPSLWDIGKVSDGVHYTAEGHRTFARNLLPVLRAMTAERNRNLQ